MSAEGNEREEGVRREDVRVGLRCPGRWDPGRRVSGGGSARSAAQARPAGAEGPPRPHSLCRARPACPEWRRPGILPVRGARPWRSCRTGADERRGRRRGRWWRAPRPAEAQRRGRACWRRPARRLRGGVACAPDGAAGPAFDEVAAGGSRACGVAGAPLQTAGRATCWSVNWSPALA